MTWSVLELANLRRWLTRRIFWLMTIPSLLTLLLIATNDYHHLITTEFRMTDHVVQTFGIANWVLTAYAFLLILHAVIALIWLALRSPRLRRPAIIMLLGMVVGFGFYTLASISPALLGPGERILLVLGPISLSYALAFFRYRILDPVPIARAAALEQIREGMLVLDMKGRIADLNPAAAAMLGSLARMLRGRLLTDVLPTLSSFLTPSHEAGILESEVSLRNRGSEIQCNASLSLLTNHQGDVLGQLLLLRDVTEQKRAQKKVLDQQRLVATLEERDRLARELHDGVAQVLGYVGVQAQSVAKWLHEGNPQKAEALLARLVEVAKDAHADVRESILGLRTGSSPQWSFLAALKQYLGNFQTNYGIRTELSFPDAVAESVLDQDAGVHLLRVVQEALTNARKHGNAQSVRISFEQQDGHTLIRIVDDGTGFDPSNVPQDGGSHFGLAFMQERMANIGGSVRIESALGAGTTIELVTPIRNRG